MGMPGGDFHQRYSEYRFLVAEQPWLLSVQPDKQEGVFPFNLKFF